MVNRLTYLSILIPTTYDREHFVDRLHIQFSEQLIYSGYETFGHHLKRVYYSTSIPNDRLVEVIEFKDDYEHSIGFKRNVLMNNAAGIYLAFIDSDDRIGPRYFEHAFEGILRGVDACGLTGIITEDGQNHKKFVHSMQYDSWFEKDGVYYRNNNHLNVVRSDIAKRMKFPETNQGEDHSYSKQLQASGLIKTEYWNPDEILYYYDYRSRK